MQQGGKNHADYQAAAERTPEVKRYENQGPRLNPRRTYLNTPRQVREEMSRVYRRMKCGQIPTAEGARLVYVLERVQKAMETEAEMLAKQPLGGVGDPDYRQLPSVNGLFARAIRQLEVSRAQDAGPPGSVLPAALPAEPSGHGAPLAAGPLPGSPDEP
jgi:hypothetical protein